jgi:hypothetical protein
MGRADMDFPGLWSQLDTRRIGSPPRLIFYTQHDEEDGSLWSFSSAGVSDVLRYARLGRSKDNKLFRPAKLTRALLAGCQRQWPQRSRSHEVLGTPVYTNDHDPNPNNWTISLRYVVILNRKSSGSTGYTPS